MQSSGTKRPPTYAKSPQNKLNFRQSTQPPDVPSAALVDSAQVKVSRLSTGSSRDISSHVHRPGIQCPACASLESEMDNLPRLSPAMMFADAAEEFVKLFELQIPNSNAHFLKKRSIDDLRQYTRALSRFFGPWDLSQISAGKIHTYYKLRASGGDGEIRWDKRANANKIMQEVRFLVRVLKRAGAWTAEHDANFQPLKHIEADIPLALSPDEQNLWLAVSAQSPEWILVHLYSLLAFATAANHIEMRQLKLRDTNLLNEYIEIRSKSAKNKYRIRTIPLDSDSQALWALERLRERARTLGSVEPHHCLFPFRFDNGTYDPARPMSVHGLNRRWRQVRAKTGLKDFNPKDTRHTAITRWAESGMPIHTIMSMAGHIDERMQGHYIHISEQAKRKAVRAASRVSPNGWGVKNAG